MKILVDYNGWQKVVDVAPEIVRRGVLEMAILPPLSVGFEVAVKAGPVPKETSVQKILVFRTEDQTPDGLLIFSNKT
jgi:hypothetical protein